MSTETRCATTVHEPSAWLRATAAARVAQIEALHLPAFTSGVIVAPLGRTGLPGSREDRRCDRCRADVPKRKPLHLFDFMATAQIHLIGGLCGTCEAKEVGR